MAIKRGRIAPVSLTAPKATAAPVRESKSILIAENVKLKKINDRLMRELEAVRFTLAKYRTAEAKRKRVKPIPDRATRKPSTKEVEVLLDKTFRTGGSPDDVFEFLTSPAAMKAFDETKPMERKKALKWAGHAREKYESRRDILALYDAGFTSAAVIYAKCNDTLYGGQPLNTMYRIKRVIKWFRTGTG